MLDSLNSDNIFANSAYLFEQVITNNKFDSQHDCQDLMVAFPHIKMRDGFVLGHYYVGDYRNAVKKLYATGLNSNDIYEPVKESELRRRPRFTWFKRYDELSMINQKLESILDDSPNVHSNTRSVIPPFREGQFIVDTIPYSASETVPPLNQYIELDFTPVAIWDAVLLLKATKLYLPHRWHGCYNRGLLVYDDTSLMAACDLRVFMDGVKAYTRTGNSSPIDYQGFLGDNRIPPKVDALSENKAIVKYCYWNNWEGLVRITLEAIRSGRSIELSDIDRKVMLEYHIGIRF